MRRHVLFAVLLLFGLSAVAQNTVKLTEEMQRQLAERTASDEQFRIIIGMAEKYDQAKLSQQAETMKGDQRREFVINELSRFSAASQADLLKTLNEGKKANIVKDVQSFWIFNGVSCVTTREMIYALSERPDISYIESDEMRNMLPEASLEMKKQNFKVENPQATKTNRDGATSIAWNVSQVHADQVWSQYNINGSGVVVAVIDTGVDYYHPDLANHMWNGGTSYPNHGWDFVNNDNNPIDDNGHGSHCSGTVAGHGTSGIQTGMAPGATIMALKVLSAAGSGSTSNITSAMTFAIEHGADVVSMSLGGHGSLNDPSALSETERDAFVTMLNAGVVAMVAAGNEGEYYSSFHEAVGGLFGTGIIGNHYSVPYNIGNAGNCPAPWRHPDQTLDGGHTAVVTIGASNRNDRKATFSSFGPCSWEKGAYLTHTYNDYAYDNGNSMGLIKPDIIVPGTDITSLLYSYHHVAQEGSSDTTHSQTTTPYVAECGTSMATPGAAGITALIIQAYKAKHGVKPTPAKIDELLEITALPVDFRTNKNNTTGAGRADAKAAIDAIYTTAAQPTGFNVINMTNGVVNNGGCVHLSWTASTTGAVGYAIYRDNEQVGTTSEHTYNEQVGTTSERTYKDEDPGVGKHTYYVRAIDANNIQSVRSNAVVCTVQPYAYADNLNITWNENGTATLGWTQKLSNGNMAESQLEYVNYLNTYTAYTNSLFKHAYWGMCFNPEDLRDYYGMSIKSVDIVVYKSSTLGIDHVHLRIYRGTTYGNTTGEPVYDENFSLTTDGWSIQHLELETPYALTDITEDLWITFDDLITVSSNEYPIGVGLYDGPSSNCFFMGSTKRTINPENDLVWSHIPDFGDAYNYAVSASVNLERTTTYTASYDLTYKNTNLGTVSGLNSYSQQYTPTLTSGENTYTVTAKATDNNNNVYTSCAKEAKIVKVDGTSSETNIDIDQTKVYLVQPTGKLTAENLTCNDHTRLIIENGGQLFTSSSNVEATVKKSIASYTDGGWNFIASPMTSLVINNTAHTNIFSNSCKLYMFDQTRELEWQNYSNNGDANHTDFTTLDNTKGYLYANGSGLTARFMGTLANSNGQVSLTYSEDNPSDENMYGWNLVGNPFPCNATIDRSCYTIQTENEKQVIKGASNNYTVAPCEGVMVKAGNSESDPDPKITFTKVTPEESASQPQQLQITLTQETTARGNATASYEDNAIVSFNEGSQLEKFYFGEGNANIYIPQNGKEFAIAVSETQGEMPLNFKAAENGSYTLTVNPENVEMHYLHLIDNLTGADVDLLQTPSYTFEASTMDYASRFRLVYSANEEDALADSETFAYYNGSVWVLATDGEATLQIVDMMGHVLVSKDNARTVSTNGIPAGVYVLRLIQGDNVKTQKIVVR